ncbi:MAG: SDR family oxidoreductase [Proteobacteria bacterium]|nr:SDR family oxidoreductase [Pseudomonadota bacterium]
MKNLFDVKDKVVVVTGGTGLLGSNYCEKLAEQGACVVVADLALSNPEALSQKLAHEYGVQTLGMACDVGSEADVIGLFQKTMEVFGRVDAVVNNAAATGEHLMRQGAVFSKFEDYPLDVWNEVIRINLTGVFLVAREGGKALLASGGGSMINVSSTYGVVGPDHRIYEGMKFASFPGYSASKAGVHGLTRWLATYWGGRGVRVNTLVPGGVENNHDPEFVRRYSARTPLGRMACRDDMVGMVVYLVSDASAYSTGQQFFVDGGWTAW